MSIFLHFLNREAYRATNTAYSPQHTDFYLRILTVARSDPLFTNFSNLLEGGTLQVSDGALTRLLIASSHLLIDGERPSLQEFIVSRVSRYQFDAHRYPMYFEKLPFTHDVVPQSIREDSITEYLAGEITSVANHRKGLSEFNLLKSDISLLTDSVSSLGKLMQTRENSGITRSLFTGKLPSITHEAAAARFISTAYVKKYMDDLNCDIATGIPGLAAFERLSSSLYETNLALLGQILRSVGFNIEAELLKGKNDELLVNLRGSANQVRFSDAVNRLCRTLYRSYGRTQSATAGFIASGMLSGRSLSPLKANHSIFESASENLELAFRKLRQRSDFQQAFEEELMAEGIIKVLLPTATKVETQALFKLAQEKFGATPNYISSQNYVLVELGSIRNLRLINVQCEAGTTGPSGSLAVLSEVIRDLKPNAVIMGGIAFGADSEKQALGDILVSKSITEYERAKVKGPLTIHRGQTVESSPKLLNTFRQAEVATREHKIRVGAMLSGEKLIDSESFLGALKTQFPEAIGGEMEGAGLLAAATRLKTDWIVVKAIVDWAKEKESQNAPDHQEKIAEKSFDFILDTLDKIGL